MRFVVETQQGIEFEGVTDWVNALSLYERLSDSLQTMVRVGDPLLRFGLELEDRTEIVEIPRLELACLVDNFGAFIEHVVV